MTVNNNYEKFTYFFFIRRIRGYRRIFIRLPLAHLFFGTRHFYFLSAPGIGNLNA